MKDIIGYEGTSIRSGKALGEYVHSITDFETKALTLSKTAKKIRTEADARLSNAQKETNSCYTSLEASKQKLKIDQELLHQLSDEQYVRRKVAEEVSERIKSKISEEKAANEKTKLSASETGCLGVGIFFAAAVVVSIITFIVGRVMPSFNNELLIAIGALVTLIITVVGVVGYKIMNNMTSKPSDLQDEYEAEVRKRYADDKVATQKSVEEGLRKVESRQKAYEKAKNEDDTCQKQREEAYRIAAECENSANEIRKHVERVHRETGVIPPDYRSLDSLIEFDRIFQNDLADTMREAVKLYEERVFRGDVIRGIDKISAQLGQLNSSMEYMQRTLTSIHNNVSMMSQDVFHITQTMDSVNSTQERILEQSKATRYAAEAVQQSQDKCEEYIKKFSA